MLSLRHLTFGYDATPVLHDITLEVPAGELTCLVGPSGCGKSTLLRLIAGLERSKSGSIALHDDMLSGPGIHVPVQRRRIGLVFQHPSLFPHLTVSGNIRFGLTHLPVHAARARCEAMLRLIGLEALSARYPHQLSGGQHQRVALARSLAPEPRAMLLDEPFANLDQRLRRELSQEIISILKTMQVPVIMVTHDPEEALMLADTMVMLSRYGRIHQRGSPDSLHNQPIDLEAARFFGHVNAVPGRVDGKTIRTKLGPLPSTPYAEDLPDGAAVTVATRPEGLRPARDDETATSVAVEQVTHTGAGWLVQARLPEGQKLCFHHIYGSRPTPGTAMRVTFEPPHIFVFPEP